MEKSLLEAFELVAMAERLLPRLEAARAELAKVESLADERAWVQLGQRRLRTARAGIADDLLIRTLRLSELDPIKGDHARAVQGAAVDALEQLHASVTMTAGPRAPLLEALYYKLKVPALRKCGRDEFEAFCADFEKRLRSGYAKRMLADADFAPVVAAVAVLERAFETWRSIFLGPPATGDEAHALRAELEQASHRLEVPVRQAKLLAQAALAPLKDIDAAALLALEAKRKRARNADDDDGHPLLERDPPDPRAPTPEERAELQQDDAS